MVAVEKLLNLMHEPQLEAGVSAMGLEFEEVVLKLPLLASMSKLMHKFRTLPWAMQNRRVSAQEVGLKLPLPASVSNAMRKLKTLSVQIRLSRS